MQSTSHQPTAGIAGVLWQPAVRELAAVVSALALVAAVVAGPLAARAAAESEEEETAREAADALPLDPETGEDPAAPTSEGVDPGEPTGSLLDGFEDAADDGADADAARDRAIEEAETTIDPEAHSQDGGDGGEEPESVEETESGGDESGGDQDAGSGQRAEPELAPAGERGPSEAEPEPEPAAESEPEPAADEPEVEPAAAAPPQRWQPYGPRPSAPRFGTLRINDDYLVDHGPKSTEPILDAFGLDAGAQRRIAAVLAPFPVAGVAFYREGWQPPAAAASLRGAEGTAIFARAGTPVIAAANGTVHRYAVDDPHWGTALRLVAADGTEYRYGHLDKLAPMLRDGLEVERGQVIGFVGRTGTVAGDDPYLYFQIAPAGRGPVTPEPYLSRWLADAQAAALGGASAPEVAPPERPGEVTAAGGAAAGAAAAAGGEQTAAAAERTAAQTAGDRQTQLGATIWALVLIAVLTYGFLRRRRGAASAPLTTADLPAGMQARPDLLEGLPEPGPAPRRSAAELSIEQGAREYAGAGAER